MVFDTNSSWLKKVNSLNFSTLVLKQKSKHIIFQKRFEIEGKSFLWLEINRQKS